MRCLPWFGMLVLACGTLQGCHKKAYLTGYFTSEQYAAQVPWATANPKYEVLPAYRDSLKTVRPFRIIAFVNNECHDTERELPRLLAIKPYLPVQELEMIGIDSTKRDAKGYTRRYDLKFTPTFIFERDGKELGRIVERTPRGKRMEQLIYQWTK